MIQFLIRILIILVIAKFISLALLWFLPVDGVEQTASTNYEPKYQRVDFKNMLGSSKTVTHIAKPQNTTVLTSMILKGLFGNSSSGYAIISLSSTPKNTTIVSIGEEYKGYILKSILTNGVILEKNSKEYILKMKTKITNSSFVSKITPQNDTYSQTRVSKRDIKHYISNPKQIWKDISLERVENPKGFKVTRIKKGSKMDALGLKRGDVIIRANNISLKSLKNVMRIYKDIKNITTMEIVVIRNNTEVELVYEID